MPREAVVWLIRLGFAQQQKTLFASGAQTFGPGIGHGTKLVMTMQMAMVVLSSNVKKVNTAPPGARAKAAVRRAYQHAKPDSTASGVMATTTMVAVRRTHSASIVL